MATLDRGQLATERSYADVQRRLKRNYRQAVHEVQQKMDAFNQRYKAADIEKRKQLSEGKITKSDYDSWKRGQVYQGKLWQQKRDSLTETLYQADVLSTKIVNGERLNVFTANANHICYNLEHTAGLDFGFSVYDNATVSKLLKDEPTLLPPRKVKHSEDVDWYHKIINNCVTQGIIQGESIPEIAKRIAETTGERGEHAAIRNARTAMTAAQNAGRIEAMHEAQALGIKLQKRWLATLDNRTRDSHQHLDGQVQNVDDPFESDYGYIMFPGDPWANPADVYNCRCTLLYEHPEYPSDIPRRDNINGEIIGDMTYDEWERSKTAPDYTEWLNAGKAITFAKDKDNSRNISEIVNTFAINNPQQSKRDIQQFFQYVDDTDGMWTRRYSNGTVQDYMTVQTKDAMNNLLDKLTDRIYTVDKAIEKQYEDIRKKLKETPLYISKQDRADIPDFWKYAQSKANHIRTSLDVGQTSLDTFYEQLMEQYPSVFPDSARTVSDRILSINNGLDSLKQNSKQYMTDFLNPDEISSMQKDMADYLIAAYDTAKNG